MDPTERTQVIEDDRVQNFVHDHEVAKLRDKQQVIYIIKRIRRARGIDVEVEVLLDKYDTAEQNEFGQYERLKLKVKVEGILYNK